MALNIRFVDDVAILSNVGRLMNDPRYVDAARDVRELLDAGHRSFVIELAGVAETGATLLGVLMTLTRQIRGQGGEVVLARVSRALRKFLDEMRMDDFWDVFEGVDDATAYYRQAADPGPDR